MNVIIIGLRGSGKSSIARLVAEAMEYSFIEIDDLTPVIFGLSTAAEALTKHGEEMFRAAEMAVLGQVFDEDNQIIASGGGTPTAPGAAELIAATSIAKDLRVIYLRATAETLAKRLNATDLSSRPSLTGMGVISEIPALLAKRDALYQSLADEILDVDQLTIEAAVARIVEFLKD